MATFRVASTHSLRLKLGHNVDRTGLTAFGSLADGPLLPHASSLKAASGGWKADTASFKNLKQIGKCPTIDGRAFPGLRPEGLHLSKVLGVISGPNTALQPSPL